MVPDLYRDATMLALPGGAICCVRLGQGPAITLLHGIPLSLATWRHTLAPLARRATVVAYDLRGFGRSEKPAGDYSVPAQARVLEQVLDAFGLPATSLVGSSYGCAPALHFARTRPDRVDRLVLINSVGYPARRHSAERLLRIGLVAALMRSALRHAPLGRALFAARLRRSYASPGADLAAEAEAYYALLRRGGGEQSFLATLRQFREAELAQMLPEIAHETLILWGGRDRVLPARIAERFRAAMRNARLALLADCGHLPHEEAPDRVNALIAEFLHRDAAASPARAAVPA